eukprot:gene10450-12358_t
MAPARDAQRVAWLPDPHPPVGFQVVEKARDDLPPYIPPTQGRFGVLTDEPELPANVNTILEDDSTDGAYAELHIAC